MKTFSVGIPTMLLNILVRTKPFRYCCIAWFALAAMLIASPAECVAQTEARIHAVFQPLELGESQWTNGFWAERQQVVELASVPQMWQIMVDDVKSQFLTNFLVASGEREGKHRGPAWNDGDFAEGMGTNRRFHFPNRFSSSSTISVI